MEKLTVLSPPMSRHQDLNLLSTKDTKGHEIYRQ